MKVSIIRCKDYSNTKESIKKSLELIGGLDDIINQNDKVLLKINLLSGATPEKAVTTHPQIIKAIIELIQEKGGKPVIGDSSGGVSAGATGAAFKKSGIGKVIENAGAELANFDKTGYKKISVPNSKKKSEIYIANPILDCDVIISLPKLKTHMLTYYTGAVKNFFGAVPAKTRKDIHSLENSLLFSEALLDIFSIVKPDLAVMDAVVGMEGNGPSHGTPRNVGLIMASKSCVALDAIASKTIGFDPLEIPTTFAAIQREIEIRDLKDIEVLGERLDDVKVNFKKPDSTLGKLPGFFNNIVDDFLSSVPYIIDSKCKKCGVCTEVCPSHAISKFLNTYEINVDKCILCYCCHELCPNAAVSLKRLWVAGFYRRFQ